MKLLDGSMTADKAKRSLKATPEGIKRANKAALTFATKKELATKLEISRATLQNFFAGNPVGRENFHKVCQKLDLPWYEIAELESDIEIENPVVFPAQTDIIALVQELRQQISASLQQKCGFMRVLDMSQPMALNDIYTNVNLLEKINGRRRLDIAALLKVCTAKELDRPGLGGNNVPIQGLEAVQRYPKLIVLGKPGAGKTTFLKHIALQCKHGLLKGDRVPIFIPLKDYAENTPQQSLLKYISEQLATIGGNAIDAVEQVCISGKALILFDGLDEVKESDCYRVLQQVRQFTAKYHLNHFIISCRLATREYTFEEFTEVEVADFSDAQIARFVTKWFASKDPSLSRKLFQKLQQQRPIHELATNPLLLTLMCLSFEESGDFPASRVELYKEGLSVMLRKWDAKRNIEREQIYKKLSLQHKEDLLSQIALQTFEHGEYFFRQPELEQQIAVYIRNIPSVNPQAEVLRVDSEAVLKAIEAQHGLLVERARGIYSFSHLTFQEYFAAREIVASCDPQALETALQKLAQRVTQPRWREVFLLSLGMLRNADYLLQLMKQQIDQLLAKEPHLQAFLNWLNHKSRSVNTPYRLVKVRSFYFDLDLARMHDLVGGALDLVRAFEPNFTRELDCNLALDLTLDRALALNRVFEITNHNLARSIDRVLARAIERAKVVEPKLATALEQLKNQLPDLAQNAKEFDLWWQANGMAWIEQVRALMIHHRDFGHVWQFNERQKFLLKQYYDANQLLVDCLKSGCYVTNTLRQEIEETMLLPVHQCKVVETTCQVV
jgi:predicted NACHT family NTPase